MSISEERVAMISGASRGIGAALAKELAAKGWRLSLGMRRPEMPDWADATRVGVFAYDAADTDASDRWAEETLRTFGRIDAVVANAGIMIAKTVIEADDADMDELLDINVKAPRRLAKSAWNALSVSGRGRIVIIASLSGKRVKSAKSGLYAVSKFAAVALAHALRHTGFDLGIRATAICPGFVATDMARSVTTRADDDMTDPRDLARIISMLIDLPNEASVAEFAINCQLEESF
ncbi:SDR family NAD(P)-dependent oxidoreductase [Rhizobium hainanense]|uniref:NADP-dependent 3-hydroxy acid dehydrogenase YdfG n=1 Tax=Rhizobium hainanense TaxID=52131 RepID=A0A1C3V9Q4_9HYPH|nr:SDR family NAD(P)-dependent oxidoreductase [Rhizobium hainanense]SCB24418.1 NADP-dependent 3-hydroxy acid dehydrogenase YdfG [Rhizobium hainanense]